MEETLRGSFSTTGCGLTVDFARDRLQRAGDPEEVVSTALYFASDATSYTTGAVVRVDGGIS